MSLLIEVRISSFQSLLWVSRINKKFIYLHAALYIEISTSSPHSKCMVCWQDFWIITSTDSRVELLGKGFTRRSIFDTWGFPHSSCLLHRQHFWDKLYHALSMNFTRVHWVVYFAVTQQRFTLVAPSYSCGSSRLCNFQCTIFFIMKRLICDVVMRKKIISGESIAWWW